MLKVEKKIVYSAFGFSIKSDIPLPELSQIKDRVDSIDIEIKFEDLTKEWLNQANKRNEFVINENFVMYHLSDIAIFTVYEGKRISVSPLRAYDEEVVRLVLLGTCMGAILMQRRIFPLHGSAIKIDGKAYAIIGDSGAGKSTLASAFLNKGFQLLTDDVIAVSFSKDNVPFVTPSYPQQKLWQESLKEFGMEISTYRPVYQRETKFAVPVVNKFSSEPLPLAGVFELVKTDSDNVEIIRIENLTRIKTILNHTYRNFFISGLGLLEWHFINSTKIVSKIDMFQLRRPISSFTAHDLVSLILNSLNMEET